jgi:hypothetical protein
VAAGKAKAMAEDVDGDESSEDEEDEDDEEEEGGGVGSSSAPVRASAPPALFTASKEKPTLSLAPRTIHVTGGQGSITGMKKTGGNVSLVLKEGQGLRELKTAIRKVLGK